MKAIPVHTDLRLVYQFLLNHALLLLHVLHVVLSPLHLQSRYLIPPRLSAWIESRDPISIVGSGRHSAILPCEDNAPADLVVAGLLDSFDWAHFDQADLAVGATLERTQVLRIMRTCKSWYDTTIWRPRLAALPALWQHKYLAIISYLFDGQKGFEVANHPFRALGPSPGVSKQLRESNFRHAFSVVHQSSSSGRLQGKLCSPHFLPRIRSLELSFGSYTQAVHLNNNYNQPFRPLSGIEPKHAHAYTRTIRNSSQHWRNSWLAQRMGLSNLRFVSCRNHNFRLRFLMCSAGTGWRNVCKSFAKLENMQWQPLLVKRARAEKQQLSRMLYFWHSSRHRQCGKGSQSLLCWKCMEFNRGANKLRQLRL